MRTVAWSRLLASLIVLLVVVLVATPARAVFGPPMDVAIVYDSHATAVEVATIVELDPSKRVLVARIADTPKGTSSSPTVRVQVKEPSALFAKVAVGQSVVIFVGKKDAKGNLPALVHLADTWLVAELLPNLTPPSWRAVQEQTEMKQYFPGRTQAMVRWIAEYKVGKSTLLNKAEEAVFAGGFRDLGKTPLENMATLAVGDVAGTGKPTLLAAGAGGASILNIGPNALEDVTQEWGLKGAAGRRAVFADVNGDGKVDLLVGKTLYINDGRKFTASAQIDLPADEQILALTVAPVEPKSSPEICVLKKDGQLLRFAASAGGKAWSARPPRALWPSLATAPATAVFGDLGDDGRLYVVAAGDNSIVRYPVDAADGAAYDFAGLTGQRLENLDKAKEGFKFIWAQTIDVNGDGRTDLLVLTNKGGMLLVNRGFGIFLATAETAKAIASSGGKPAPFSMASSVAWTTADLRGQGCQDLLVLAGDGHLYAVLNSLHPAKPGGK